MLRSRSGQVVYGRTGWQEVLGNVVLYRRWSALKMAANGSNSFSSRYQTVRWGGWWLYVHTWRFPALRTVVRSLSERPVSIRRHSSEGPPLVVKVSRFRHGSFVTKLAVVENTMLTVALTPQMLACWLLEIVVGGIGGGRVKTKNGVGGVGSGGGYVRVRCAAGGPNLLAKVSMLVGMLVRLSRSSLVASSFFIPASLVNASQSPALRYEMKQKRQPPKRRECPVRSVRSWTLITNATGVRINVQAPVAAYVHAAL